MSAFVDTNILVRHLTGDPPDQAARATKFLAAADELLLPDLTVAEVVYVLESFYEVGRRQVAELVREAVLEDVRDELPHSITVAVEEMGLREGRPKDRPLLDVYASLIVERDSQKGIIIGHHGERLRALGEKSRRQIEALLGTPVYLDLRVKVLKEWQRNPKHLNRLGF